MPALSSNLLALLLSPTLEGFGTGREWMPVTAILLAVVTLILIVWLGSRNTV